MRAQGPHFSGKVSYGIDEYIIVPGYQPRSVTPDKVDLGIVLRDVRIPVGWLSAAMGCVSGDKLGIALAQHGGCAVLPYTLSVTEQVREGRNIKKAKAGFNYDVITVSPGDPVKRVMDLQAEHGYSTFPVVDSKRRLKGVITQKNFDPRKDSGVAVQERMVTGERLVYGQEGVSRSQADKMLLENSMGILPLVDKEGRFVCARFWSDLKKQYLFPNEFVDGKGRYRYAAAISTWEDDYRERAEAMVTDGECDLLVLDTSNAKNEFARDAVRYVRKKFPDTPVVAGNVVDPAGFAVLAKAGADMVKVGLGPGDACKTRLVTGTGRGQGTAITDVALFRNQRYPRVLLCGDGGLGRLGLINKAYAAGADAVMMGSYFGGFKESAAELVEKEVEIELNGKRLLVTVWVKEYWGEASERAMNLRRYVIDAKENFVPEGVEGYIRYKGSIHDPKRGIEPDIAFVKKTLSRSGARNPKEFCDRVVLELQSEGSRREGTPKV